jgi:hypothetical protein
LLRRIFLSQAEGQLFGAELKGRTGTELLAEIVATGRCYWMTPRKNSRALSLGASARGQTGLAHGQRGWQEPVLEVDAASGRAAVVSALVRG